MTSKYRKLKDPSALLSLSRYFDVIHWSVWNTPIMILLTCPHPTPKPTRHYDVSQSGNMVETPLCFGLAHRSDSFPAETYAWYFSLCDTYVYRSVTMCPVADSLMGTVLTFNTVALLASRVWVPACGSFLLPSYLFDFNSNFKLLAICLSCSLNINPQYQSPLRCLSPSNTWSVFFMLF